MTGAIEPDGFSHESHREWIEAGHCAALDYKTYCSGNAGHNGDHWAPRIAPDGTITQHHWKTRTK